MPYVKRRLENNTEDVAEEGEGHNVEDGEEGDGETPGNKTESYLEAVNDVQEEINNKSFMYNPELEHEDENSKALVKKLEDKHYEDNLEKLYENSGQIDKKSDQLCSWVQIITACFSSFAHGSNDVADAVALRISFIFIECVHF